MRANGIYRLNSAILAILTGSERGTVLIPEGDTLTVLEGQHDTRVVDVHWAGKTVTVFISDLTERAVPEG